MARPKTYSASTKILDLDALDQPTIVIKLKGTSHELKPITVRDFVSNTKEVEALEAAKKDKVATLEDEMTSVIKMLTRSFPTMKEEDLWEMSLPRLYQIFEFAKQHNGSDTGAKEAETSSPANPPVPAPAPAATEGESSEA